MSSPCVPGGLLNYIRLHGPVELEHIVYHKAFQQYPDPQGVPLWAKQELEILLHLGHVAQLFSLRLQPHGGYCITTQGLYRMDCEMAERAERYEAIVEGRRVNFDPNQVSQEVIEAAADNAITKAIDDMLAQDSAFLMELGIRVDDDVWQPAGLQLLTNGSDYVQEFNGVRVHYNTKMRPAQTLETLNNIHERFSDPDYPDDHDFDEEED